MFLSITSSNPVSSKDFDDVLSWGLKLSDFGLAEVESIPPLL